MRRAVDVATLVRVSRMYYELGETQESIAVSLGVTRPQVSKLLKQARAQGVVEIRIVERTERPSTVAAELQRRFGLRAVHVAPTFAGSDERTRRRVGRLAAQVLTAAVRDGMIAAFRRRNYPPERVADNILKAVRRNRGVAPISPEAWFGYVVKRFAPWAIAWMNRKLADRVRRQVGAA